MKKHWFDCEIIRFHFVGFVLTIAIYFTFSLIEGHFKSKPIIYNISICSCWLIKYQDYKRIGFQWVSRIID